MPIADFYRGDTKRYRFTFTDAAGAAVDITGWELWFTMKVNRTDLDVNAVIQVRHTVGNDLNDNAAGGIAFLTIPSTLTDVAIGRYYYGIQRVIPGSPPDVRTLETDKVKVLQDITLDNT